MVIEFKGRVLVPGEVRGETVVVDSISFYGDVDPERGVLRADGRVIKDRVLVAKRGRGSTVGSYVIYSMKKKGTAPLALLMKRAEPIIVAGSVLARIPLIDMLPDEFFSMIRDGVYVTLKKDGKVILEVEQVR